MHKSILLIGESGVGKTHYGAQLLIRLMNSLGTLQMSGAATNLEPFESALECLGVGKAAAHTPISTYIESVWPVTNGRDSADLIWPDYGGEQVRSIVATRRLPLNWRDRIVDSSNWIFVIRLRQIRTSDDIFSTPLHALKSNRRSEIELKVSDQARLIELLQILLYARASSMETPLETPNLSLLLSCWDELENSGRPAEALRTYLPMFCDFVYANWKEPRVYGLSALEKALSPRARDREYTRRGPESFGYVILPTGERSSDLTIPVLEMLKLS